jgi:hypothetical protein
MDNKWFYDRVMRRLILCVIAICFSNHFHAQKISLNASIDNGMVNFDIDTDIPLPIEVMVSLSLRGLKSDDYAVGFSHRVKIDESPKTISFEAKNSYGSQNLLPNGSYDAKVSFYTSWGTNNPTIKSTYPKNIITSQKVQLKSNLSIRKQKSLDKMQGWGINVSIGDNWNEKLYEKNLGRLQELVTEGRDPNVVKTYYYPEADMTFFVSATTNKVLIWKLGKTNKL